MVIDIAAEINPGQSEHIRLFVSLLCIHVSVVTVVSSLYVIMDGLLISETLRRHISTKEGKGSKGKLEPLTLNSSCTSGPSPDPDSDLAGRFSECRDHDFEIHD